MRRVAVFYNSDGSIIKVRTGSIGSIEAQLSNDPTPALVFAADEFPKGVQLSGVRSFYVDVVKKELVKIPEQPSATHKFDFSTKQWVDSTEEVVKKTLLEIRRGRTRLLFDSDWTQVPDAPLTDEQRAAWREYRQQLRDITDEYPDATDINTVQWPTPPSV